VAVWRSWYRRWWDQRSYSTPGPVSTGRGDRIGIQLLVREIYLNLANHPGQLSLAIPPWVGAKGDDALRLGRKADMVLFAALCDPHLSGLEAFAHRCAIQIHINFTLVILIARDIPYTPLEYFHTFVQHSSMQ